MPLDEEDDGDLCKETFLNEPSTKTIENKMYFLTAAIVESGNEMAAWSFG
jgi:hypothetical protein